MIYFITCSIIIFAFIFALLYSLIRDYKYVDNKLFRVTFCILLTLLFKYDFGYIFCGLEYEDSYAFSFLGKELANNIFTSSFLSEGIGIGSLDSPEMMQTYGGHFITYSTFLSYPIRFFGFSLTLISIITTLLNFGSLLILSVFPNFKDRYMWVVAPSLFCISPIINVFGNTFLSEPFSSFIILSFVYLYYNYLHKKVHLLFPVITFAIALITKRENMALFFIPLMISFVASIQNKKLSKANIKEISLFAGILILYLLFIQNVFNIEAVESVDINAPTFSISYFLRLAPVFLKALITPSYFSISFFLFILSITYSVIRNKNYNYGSIVSLLWIIYLCLYTFHYRGYFFVTEDNINVFDSFRYLNNFYCLIPVAIAFQVKKMKMNYVITLLGVLLALSFYPTFAQRREYNEMEQYERFDIPSMALKKLKNKTDIHNATIIYTEILVLQNLVEDSIRICDVVNIDRLDLLDNKSNYYLICKDEDIPYFKKRYGIQLNLNEWTVFDSIYEYNIYTIRK